MSQRQLFVNSTRLHDELQMEWLKSQKEENRNCLQKIVQSISYLSHRDITLRKGNQDMVSNFKQCLLRAEDDEFLQKWIETFYDKHMSLNVQMKCYKSWL